MSMIKRIIFLIRSPFTLRDYKRFGIELLQRNGFKVEVWGITPVLYPEVYHNYVPADLFNFNELTIFHDKSKLCSKLSILKNSDFVMNAVEYATESVWVYRALSNSAADYAVFMTNAIPAAGITDSRVFVYFKRLKGLFPPTSKKILNTFITRIPFKWLGIRAARLILAGGAKSISSFRYPTDTGTEVLWTHAMDYDLYLENKCFSSESRKTAVFLDTYFPFDCDFLYYSKVKSPISAETYYPLLNKFFGLVEKRLGFEVIIAAHPHSHYEKDPDFFQGRMCIRGKTVDLIRESQLVLNHYSTAVSFANLFYKPVIFLTLSELDKFRHTKIVIKEMAEWFGKKPIFIDRDYNINWDFELAINKDRYHNYRRAYIKTDHSEDLFFWQIVSNRLKR